MASLLMTGDGKVVNTDVACGAAWQMLQRTIGPALIVGVAFVDPGNLKSSLSAGLQTGLSSVWVLVICTLLSWLFQHLHVAAHVGLASNRDLASTCRLSFGPRMSFVLWIMVEVAIVAAEVQATIGAASAVATVFSIPFWGSVLVLSLDTFSFLIFLEFASVERTTSFFLLLVFVTCCSLAVLCGPQLQANVPPLGHSSTWVEESSLQSICGFLGAVVMPGNLFFHSRLVQSKVSNKSEARQKAIYWSGLGFGLVVLLGLLTNLAVTVSFASFFKEGGGACHVSNERAAVDCADISLSDSILMLRDKVGITASNIW
jgi:NRAMP (natural resistance-associated macrophage protein)-like metal ion transporter